jgi:NADPH-dependent ferric siderophore reductase
MAATTSPGMGRRLLGQFFQAGKVTRVDHLTPRMRRITLAAAGLSWMPGQQVRVCVGDIASPAAWLDGLRRTYSVWDYDGALLQLCILDHGDGPGARWARSVRPDLEVLFGSPEGPLVVRPAAYHVFVGEETAAVAFGPMLRALAQTGADCRGVLEVDSAADQLPLGDTTTEPPGLTWRYRNGAPAEASATLLAAIEALDLPPEPGSAYVAGEARTVQAVARHFVRDRGWPRRAVRTKPFWSPGKTGMD